MTRKICDKLPALDILNLLHYLCKMGQKIFAIANTQQGPTGSLLEVVSLSNCKYCINVKKSEVEPRFPVVLSSECFFFLIWVIRSWAIQICVSNLQTLVGSNHECQHFISESKSSLLATKCKGSCENFYDLYDQLDTQTQTNWGLDIINCNSEPCQSHKAHDNVDVLGP